MSVEVKFGGSMLKNVNDFGRAADVVVEKLKRSMLPLCVVSAMNGMCSVEEVKESFSNFAGEPQKLGLPSAPSKPIVVLEDEFMPQPRLHGDYGGMVTLVGRVREDTVFENGMVYVLTSDNTDRGAGGGAVLTAEYLKATGYLGQPQSMNELVQWSLVEACG